MKLILKKISLILLLNIPIFAISQNNDRGVLISCPPNCGSDRELIYLKETITEKTKSIINDKAKLLVYPNPASNILGLNLELENIATSKIQILNSIGQIVLQQQFSNNIEISELVEGWYYVQVSTSAQEIFRAKFIKIK